MNKYVKLNKKIKTFTRDGKKNPENLIASDWILSTAYGYHDSYAYISSVSLNMYLAYSKNKYPLLDFISKDIFKGNLQMGRDNENKQRLSIDDSFDLVFTEDGLIPTEEYYEALDQIEAFEANSLSFMDMVVGKCYLTIEGKFFIYLGYETLASGHLSRKPKIQEIDYPYKWDHKFTPNYSTIKKAKSIGNICVVKELELSDIEMTKWKNHHFNEFTSYISSHSDNIN